MKENLLTGLLNQKSIQFLFKIFEDYQDDMALIGGCVRDFFLEKTTKDFDVATKLSPSRIIKILNKNNLKYETYAFKYGSISTIIQNQKFQITTLREDFNQTGRDTNILFTDCWKKDAARRDFTINTIYLFSDGYQDQFGGPKGKKFLTKKFRELIHEISSNTMSNQKQRLNEEFDKWKNKEDQTDDILVIGLEL